MEYSQKLIEAAARITFFKFQLYNHASQMKKDMGLKEFIESIIDGTHCQKVEKFKREQIEFLNKIIEIKESVNIDFTEEIESIKDIELYEPTTIEKILNDDLKYNKNRNKGFYDPKTFSHN